MYMYIYIYLCVCIYKTCVYTCIHIYTLAGGGVRGLGLAQSAVSAGICYMRMYICIYMYMNI